MSRAGKQRRNGSRQKPAGPILTRRDRLGIGLIFLAVPLLFGAGVAIELHFRHEARIRRTLAGWRARYHLTDIQERLAREEEERFHGTANLLERPHHTPEETLAHETAISRLMNPEDGERFLADHHRTGRTSDPPHP